MLSIITPTYNREEKLNRVYESLKNSTCKDFEWIVVDDGSIDNTEKLINDFIKEKKITIRYIKKENGGKPSAYNIGVNNANGNILLCLDSDDFLTNDAIDTILNDYETIKEYDNIAGIVYNSFDINKNNTVVGTELPDNIIDTYYSIYTKYKVSGDKLNVLKTNIAKKYLFPVIEGEKFIPEALVNNRISKKYNHLYRNLNLKGVEYLENGLSSNYFNLVKNNPLGNRLYFKELYDINNSFYNVYGYILFSLYGKVSFKKIISEHPAKIKVLLLYIPTFIISKIK